jgi:hypothetical protein
VAAATTAQEAQDDEETFEPDPTATPGPTALMAGAFRHFYKDQSKLSPAKIGWIVMMMADQHNYGLTVMHKGNVAEAISSGESPSSITPPTLISPQTFAESFEVFEKIMSMKGYYSKIFQNQISWQSFYAVYQTFRMIRRQR